MYQVLPLLLLSGFCMFLLLVFLCHLFYGVDKIVGMDNYFIILLLYSHVSCFYPVILFFMYIHNCICIGDINLI